MHRHPVDRLFAGLFLTVAVTVTAIVALSLLPFAGFDDGFSLRPVIAGAIVAACVVFPRTLLLRTVWRKRRSPFLLDDVLNNMLIGRAIGLIGGVIAGVWVLSKTA